MYPSSSPLSILVAVFVCGLLFAGCQSESGPGTVHPIDSHIPHFENPDHTIGLSDPTSEDISGQLQAKIDAPAWSVGVQEGSGPELFGRIVDIAVDEEERLLVLDYENREVRIFSSEGEYLSSFGQKGEGPGEFQYPYQLARFDSGKLAVLGRMGRVQFFEPSGTSYEHTGGYTVEFTPEDACILDDTIFIHGFWPSNPDHSIFAFSKDGEQLRSFGPVYQAEDTGVRMGLSQGSLACDSTTDVIAFGFARTSFVYGFGPKGTLRWVTQLNPFEPAPAEEIVREGRKGMSFRSEAGTDYLADVVEVPGGGFLTLRQRITTVKEQTREYTMHAYWVSPKQGKGHYIGSGTGHVRYVGPERLYSQEGEFPQISVYDIQGISWDGHGERESATAIQLDQNITRSP